MELLEDQISEKYAKQYRHFLKFTLLPYENEITGI